MTFIFDQRWCGRHGIGRFATELRCRLRGFSDIDLNGNPLALMDPILVARELYRQRTELYLSPGFNVPIVAPCSVIITIHDMIHMRVHTEQSWKKNAYYFLVQRRIVRHSPCVLTVSHYSKNEICEWYGIPESRVAVVGNGVSSAFSPEGCKSVRSHGYFVSVVNAKKYKNLPFLLQAFAKVQHSVRCDLVIVAKPDALLLSLVEQLNLFNRVQFVHEISDEDLASIYRGALCLIMPSRYEGFGLPVIEAMASGCPVLCSNATSLPEVAGDAAVFFDPEEIDELCDLMVEAAANRLNFAEMRARGLGRAAQYSWDRVVERVEKVVAEVTIG